MSPGSEVPRSCFVQTSQNEVGIEPRPLAEFRHAPAYVLLGDPGAGKTTAFREECKALGDRAEFLTARHFLRIDLSTHPEWKDKTLFIDGLDEVRAGQTDARSSIDNVISRLDALGKPSFRLSCRAADWLGSNDLENLSVVSPEDRVKVLHLTPLTRDDVLRILQSRLTKTEPEIFLSGAHEHGLSGLLANPLTLDMLIRLANEGERLPESRGPTFEKFCALLAEERNDDHSIISRDENTEAILNAAGRLNAVQLLAGMSGYTTGHEERNEGYLKLGQTGCEDRSLLRSALSKRLFVSEGESHFAPGHRHIAEYLAARHLAALIADGLPPKRVISLITGVDGVVVTELRGLSAWLAALSPGARRSLINGDPIGVCLYGDIHDFTPSEKRELLTSLKKRTTSLYVSLPSDAAKSLTSPDMAPAILEVLEDATSTEEHKEITFFLLDALSKGLPSQEFSEALFSIVLDSERGPGIQQYALRAFLHNSEGEAIRTAKLTELLTRIRSGSLLDPDRRLQDIALSELYPHELQPSEIWDYLPEVGRPGSPMPSLGFWRRQLTEDLSPKQVGVLIEGLIERMPNILDVIERQHLSEVPLRVLEQALQKLGDSVDTTTLYEWLSTAERVRWRVYKGEKSLATIRDWLAKRPDVQKCLILEGLSRSSGPGDVLTWALDAKARLCHTAFPPDYGPWCIEQAIKLVDDRPWVAEYLVQEAFSHRGQNEGSGLSIDEMQLRIEGLDVLESKLDRLLNPPPPPNWELEMQERKDERRVEWDLEEAKELDYIRSQIDSLRENRAPPALLHQLAEVYLGYQVGSDRVTGRAALESYLKGDQTLIQAALTGLEKTVDRSDIPSVSEILHLRSQSRMHYLNLPFLASMHILNIPVSADLSEHDIDMYRTALMFYYCGFVRGEYTPKWYGQLLGSRPDIVADVQLQFSRVELKRSGQHVDGMFELAHDQSHAEIARNISLPLLRSFPTRCRTGQLGTLKYLLWAAIQYADRDALSRLIADKVALKSMNVAQRAHWLAAGLVISSESFGEMASDFSSDSYNRSRSIADFFGGGRYPDNSELMNCVDLRAAGLIVHMVGRHFGPELLNVAGVGTPVVVTPAMEASQLVNQLVAHVAASASTEAGQVLETLSSDASLSNWRSHIDSARETQRVTRRDTLYEHPIPERVVTTLSGGTPANPGDLAALLEDLMEDLACEIRTSNTIDWRQYWNLDHNRKPQSPRHENECRNTLLSHLRKMFPKGVHAQPEWQSADEKRPDIMVAYNSNICVPIETKKNQHRDLWTAMHRQLIKYYTSDPNTGGYGIYLVFWFGPNFTKTPPPQGRRPETANGLKERLEATLSEEQKHRITVSVVDVARR